MTHSQKEKKSQGKHCCYIVIIYMKWWYIAWYIWRTTVVEFRKGHKGPDSVLNIVILKHVRLCSFLCRSVVVDEQKRIAHFLLPPKAEILLQSPTRSVLLVRDIMLLWFSDHCKAFCAGLPNLYDKGSLNCLVWKFWEVRKWDGLKVLLLPCTCRAEECIVLCNPALCVLCNDLIFCCFFLPQYRVYAVPSDEFTMELIQPTVLCISHHGQFVEDRWGV